MYDKVREVFELTLKFLLHNPALSISTVEKEAGLPQGTLTKADANRRRTLDENIWRLFCNP
jgi:hypothetical protein